MQQLFLTHELAKISSGLHCRQSNEAVGVSVVSIQDLSSKKLWNK